MRLGHQCGVGSASGRKGAEHALRTARQIETPRGRAHLRTVDAGARDRRGDAMADPRPRSPGSRCLSVRRAPPSATRGRERRRRSPFEPKTTGAAIGREGGRASTVLRIVRYSMDGSRLPPGSGAGWYSRRRRDPAERGTGHCPASSRARRRASAVNWRTLPPVTGTTQSWNWPSRFQVRDCAPSGESARAGPRRGPRRRISGPPSEASLRVALRFPFRGEGCAPPCQKFAQRLRERNLRFPSRLPAWAVTLIITGTSHGPQPLRVRFDGALPCSAHAHISSTAENAIAFP